jgi:peptide/nickel transport system substrate-binding protein
MRRRSPSTTCGCARAIHLAISREESLKTLYKGEGVLGGYSMPGPWALPRTEVEKIPGYAPYKDSNIAQAKALLAAAGFPNGFKEQMLVRRVPLFETHAIFMKDQLNKIGIDITLDIQETATYNESRRLRRFKLDAGGRSFSINDPDAMYGDSVTCDGALNFAKLCDAKIDDLFSRQSQEIDPAKRVALVRELEARALAQYSTYMLYFRSQFRFMQKTVHGWALHPNEDNAMRREDCWKARA